MLTQASYMTAIYVYCGAAVMIALLLAWWLLRRWPGFWAALVVTLGAALLLTPAYPQPDVDTMAPALVVAGFELFLKGPEAAMHAIKPLGIASAAALVMAMLLYLAVLRPRRLRADAAQAPQGQAETEAQDLA